MQGFARAADGARGQPGCGTLFIEHDVTTSLAPLRTRLRPWVALHYPGFDRMREISDLLFPRVRVFAFEQADCRAWYRRFADDVFRALDESRYLPVYRMGDGEFAFALGPADEFLPLHRLGPRRALKRAWKWATGRLGEHRSGASGYGWEVYSPAERRALLERYAADLAFVAQRGYLALGLDDSELFAPYHPFIQDWLDGAGVHLHAGNYQHFYVVYALLNGPDRERLLQGRSVLVVNHLSDGRRDIVEAALRAAGAARVQFLGISRDKAMFETLDLGAVRRPVDLALVGAGVGAANVLRQLEPLAAVSLDAGFVLDILAQPEMRWNRPFCVPDAEFDVDRVRFLTEGQLRTLRARGMGRPVPARAAAPG